MMVISPRTALESRRLIKLAWPLLIAQITQMLMGVSDTIIAGRYSAVDMAAVALGFSISIPIMSFIQGIALAIPPLIARLQGAKSHDDVANATRLKLIEHMSYERLCADESKTLGQMMVEYTWSGC